MPEQGRDDAPAIVTYRIPRIEIYYVLEDELARIEEGCGQVAQDLSFALACSSFCVAFIIALMTGTFGPKVALALTVAAVVSGLAALYTGLRWFNHRKQAPKAIARIRRRKINPETATQDQQTASPERPQA